MCGRLPSAAAEVNTTAAVLGLPEHQRVTIHGVLALHGSVLMLWGRQCQRAIAADEFLRCTATIGDAAQCTLRFTPCVDGMRAGTHSGNAVLAETYPQLFE